MTNIYLNVSFIEKDQVKLLGGRWDSNLKKWYIPSGLDVSNFSKWLPEENQLSVTKNYLPTTTANTATNANTATTTTNLVEPNLDDTYSLQANNDQTKNQNSISLSQLLQKVSLAIQNIRPNKEWIRAEISEVVVHKTTNHCYLELIETSNGVLLSKVKAIILKDDYPELFSKFKQVTGDFLKPGMQVLILVKLNFSIQYGLSLYVKDLDPNYTLGDLAAKLSAIRESLKKEGIYNLNKQLPIPTDFTRIAVLSPSNAAGLGDFKREAALLQKHKLCDFYYYTAQFQGENAALEIMQALNNIFVDHKSIDFDIVVIIRGGGAAIDLAWLNDYQLAKLICESKIMVFSGIGHERDNTIIDEVAGVRFDTPSKVIAHILGVIIRNAQQAEIDFKDIKNLISNFYINNNNCLTTEMHQILKLTELNMLRLKQNLTECYIKIHQHSKLSVNYINLQLIEYLKNIKIILPKLYLYIDQELDLNFYELLRNIKELHYRKLDEIQKLLANIISLGPKATLERGYVLVREIFSPDKVLVSKEQAKSCKELYLEFHDGYLKVNNNGEV